MLAFATRRARDALGLGFAVLALVTAGCGSAGGVSSEKREAAEKKLHEIDTKLDQVMSAYRSGNKDQASKLARSIGPDLYEGTAEGVVAKEAAAVNRQLDPLIEASIPAKVKEGAAPAEVDQLVKRAHDLISEAREKIEKGE
jgi:hypothetical protein